MPEAVETLDVLLKHVRKKPKATYLHRITPEQYAKLYRYAVDNREQEGSNG